MQVWAEKHAKILEKVEIIRPIVRLSSPKPISPSQPDTYLEETQKGGASPPRPSIFPNFPIRSFRDSSSIDPLARPAFDFEKSCQRTFPSRAQSPYGPQSQSHTQISESKQAQGSVPKQGSTPKTLMGSTAQAHGPLQAELSIKGRASKRPLMTPAPALDVRAPLRSFDMNLDNNSSRQDTVTRPSLDLERRYQGLGGLALADRGMKMRLAVPSVKKKHVI
jgi:hypothetical protein